ncbi:MAG: carboxypeptidase-like regulatory domain-containing protein [Lachnospira sp.]
MKKRIFSIMIMLTLLLNSEVCLGQQLPSLSTARIIELQELAGENSAQWIEGTPPSSDMNAFQMWQWTDWFLSNRVRSLLGTIQDYEQMEPYVPLNAQVEEDQWQLRETENILSRFESQLEEDRLTILNGISAYQSDETSDTERLMVWKRMLEAESEIRQIIGTICADYDTYLSSVDNCYRGLQENYDVYTRDVHDNAYNSLVQSAEALEMSENAATADFSVSVISTHQFSIRVCAPDQSPIENATVTVTNQLNETQKQTYTDAQGNAVFWVGDLGADEKGELLLNLHIEAEGYRTREMQTIRLCGGETRSIDLQKDDGTPYLIMGCFNGKDILTESNTYYWSQENTANYTFSVKLHCDMDGELELCYSVDANATEYRTVVKSFFAADSDNTVLEFEDQWLSKLLPGAKVSFTLKADGKQYTTNTLLIIQKAMVEKPISDTSAQPSFAVTQMPQSASSNSVTGREVLEPISTEKLLSQLDVATDDIQFAKIGEDTYLFWIQPGTEGQTARLNWYNLTDMSHHGAVSYLQGRGQQPLRQNNSYKDYAFALEADGDFCALTILSGVFPKATTGDEPVTPSNACVTTVLMQQSDGRGLDMKGYQDGAVFAQSGNYPVMPEVRLLENNGEVSVLSTYSTADNPEKLGSHLYDYLTGYSDDTGTYLKKTQSLTCADEAEITRYCIVNASASGQNVTFYTLNANGELSRLSSNTGSRDVLAQGEIISFRVMTGAESGTSEDKLFYLEQVRTEEGGTIHRLKSVTSDGKQKTDYEIETGATIFDIVSFDGGVYLYWTECSTPDASSGIEEEYLVRCVRYDSSTDTAYGPFSLVELNESPGSIKLQSSDTGFYTVDLQNAVGSFEHLSLSRFTFGTISSAEMTEAVLSDPCVSTGDYTELVFSVKNTGNVPLSALDVEIIDTETDSLVQMLHIDLDNPELNTNKYYFHGENYTITGTNAFRRISRMYDPLNNDSWEIIDSTAEGSTVRSVRTDLLMPGGTCRYQTKIQIPADWEGRKTLIAKIVDVTGESALSSRQTEEELLLIGTSQSGSMPTVRLGSGVAKEIDTDAHDLMLSAQLFQRSGEDYVHITIRNRSGNKNSDVKPILTASYRDNNLYSHAFCNPMGDDFGYSMDIPLQTLINGQCLTELDLYVSDADYEDFAESDNHVRLLLTVQLCVVDQPVSITATEGEEAMFSVLTVGGEKPYCYQWQSMTGIDQWTNIPDATQDTYRIASVQLEQNGLTVHCVITDQLGNSITSDPAALSVQAKPAADRDTADNDTKSPQTGDNSYMELWIVLLFVSGGALIGTKVISKMRKRSAR